MNNKRRSFRNISELVIYDIKQEIIARVKRYINLIQEYQNESKAILPGDVLHEQASTIFGDWCMCVARKISSNS